MHLITEDVTQFYLKEVMIYTKGKRLFNKKSVIGYCLVVWSAHSDFFQHAELIKPSESCSSVWREIPLKFNAM